MIGSNEASPPSAITHSGATLSVCLLIDGFPIGDLGKWRAPWRERSESTCAS